MLTPLLICSLLKDVSLPNHHHGKVVVSVAMRPCMQLLALEEVAPPPPLSLPPRCRQLFRVDMKIVLQKK